MRVVVDAHPLLQVRPGLGPTGVGRWTATAVRGLAEAAPDWSIELVTFGTPLASDLGWGPNVSTRSLPIPNRAYKLLRAADALFLGPLLGRADATLGPGFITFRGVARAELPVVHDLAHVKFPDYVSRQNLTILRRVLPKVVRRAARVITVSETVRDEAAAFFGLERAGISVVPPGWDPDGPSSDTRPPRVPDRYLLFVGTIEPRKNLAGALDAYRDLAGRRPEVPPLVVAGGEGWGEPEVTERLHDPRLAARVVMLGYVDDEVLSGLYRGAEMLIFPSFYEGFGLPVVEAMAAGCPVVASNRGAIPEVAGDAALLVDPNDVRALADAIDRVSSDGDLRAKLRADGAARAELFTRDRAGTALKAAIEAAVAAKSLG